MKTSFLTSWPIYELIFSQSLVQDVGLVHLDILIQLLTFSFMQKITFVTTKFWAKQNIKSTDQLCFWLALKKSRAFRFSWL